MMIAFIDFQSTKPQLSRSMDSVMGWRELQIPGASQGGLLSTFCCLAGKEYKHFILTTTEFITI